jgi:hypothetical protein
MPLCLFSVSYDDLSLLGDWRARLAVVALSVLRRVVGLGSAKSPRPRARHPSAMATGIRMVVKLVIGGSPRYGYQGDVGVASGSCL